MINLTSSQLNQMVQNSVDYRASLNAATGSKLDANANVSVKNVATEEVELVKDFLIQFNRTRVSHALVKLYGPSLAVRYQEDLNNHFIYTHDETSIKPYCTSISMYPFLLNGLQGLGGDTTAPKHLRTFVGGFINLLNAIASQFAGAVATVEFMTYFDHFARLEYGDEYRDAFDTTDSELYSSDWAKNIRHDIHEHFAHVIYTINQPAANRGYQAIFWNITVFDQGYFESMFEGFVFPDMDRPNWASTSVLQREFLRWFNKEREKAVLTFPVVTAALLNDGADFKDLDTATFLAKEMSEGNSFFIYTSQSADSLASCCRLRNEVTDNVFSHSLGAGGVMTGSLNVITINLNRTAQLRNGAGIELFHRRLKEQVQRVHAYQEAHLSIYREYLQQGMLTAYDAGFIAMEKQFLTIGLNGLVEAAEYFLIRPDNNPIYRKFVQDTLKIIYDENRAFTARTGVKVNTEFVPAESLGVKNAMWDMADGLKVQRDCYNSYFYRVEDDMSPLDKMQLFDRDMTKYLDGGSALHLNMEDLLDEERWMGMMRCAIAVGVQYFCFNVKSTICNTCNHIDKRTLNACSKCGSHDVDGATRVIGYLKRISNFSKARQEEHSRRHYSQV